MIVIKTIIPPINVKIVILEVSENSLKKYRKKEFESYKMVKSERMMLIINRLSYFAKRCVHSTIINYLRVGN